MNNNLLEQLGEFEVPPLPNDFHGQIHRRLNDRLVITHLADLLLRGLPLAMLEFVRPVVSLMLFSLSGKMDNKLTDDDMDHPSE